MKVRLWIVLLLTVLILTMASAMPALADSPRKATGGVQFTMPLTGIPPDVNPLSRSWAMFNIVEKYPGGPVSGWYTWHAYHPYYGWVKMNTRVVCAAFDEPQGEVVFAAQITMFTPTEPEDPEYWPEEVPYPAPGRYVKIWAHDGGSPGASHDAFGFYVDLSAGSPSPSFSSNPGCASGGIMGSFPIEGGNLVIHD